MDEYYSSSIYCVRIGMKCYVVLWLPKIVHCEIENLGEPKEFKENISDLEGISLFVNVRLMKSKDIEIGIYDNPDNANLSSHFITLKYEDHSCNGTILYSYNEKIYRQKPGFGFTAEFFPKAIYHLIKSFYHQHDFHEEECDSILTPYISTQKKGKPDIHKANNKALLHYLKCYEEMLKNTVTYVQILLNKMRKQTQNWTVTSKQFNLLPKLCLRVHGYEVYMGTLYYSRYNTMCRTDVCQIGKLQKELRQRAFNIENALRYIKAVEYEFDVMYQQKNTNAILAAANEIMNKTAEQAKDSIESTEAAAKESSKLSTIWAIGGIVVSLLLGIISLWYSGKTAKESSEELKTVREELSISIGTLSGVISEMDNQVEQLVQEDYMIENIKNVQGTLNEIDDKLTRINKIVSGNNK